MYGEEYSVLVFLQEFVESLGSELLDITAIFASLGGSGCASWTIMREENELSFTVLSNDLVKFFPKLSF